MGRTACHGWSPCERGREPAPRCGFDEMAGDTDRASDRLEQDRAETDQLDVADRFIFGAHRTRKSAQTPVIFGLRNRMEQGVGQRNLTQQLHRVMIDVARAALFQPLGDAPQAGGKTRHRLGATGDRQQHQPLFKCARWYGESMRIGGGRPRPAWREQRSVGNELS